ncbi:MAG: ISKra4 family transposase, partial [Patescibacteria group bacterium]
MAQEIDRLIQHVFRDITQLGHIDLEASEMAIRATSHRIGGRLLEKLLNADGGGYRGTTVECRKGHRARFVEYREKELVTVLSAANVRRAYYHCDLCGEGVIPKDLALDIVDTSFSPGKRRMMGQVGGKEAFDDGRKDLEILAGV